MKVASIHTARRCCSSKLSVDRLGRPHAPNSMLTNAGFTAKRANTPAQVALLNSLPANKFVRQTANRKVTYLYADPRMRLRPCRQPERLPERQGHAEHRL